MNNKSKALKRHLRGIDKLAKALNFLGWARWSPPGGGDIAGYIIGPAEFVAYVADLIMRDLAEDEPKEDYEVSLSSDAKKAAEEFMEENKELMQGLAKGEKDNGRS